MAGFSWVHGSVGSRSLLSLRQCGEHNAGSGWDSAWETRMQAAASVVRLGSCSCSLYRGAARTGLWDLTLSLVETSQLRDSGWGWRVHAQYLVTWSLKEPFVRFSGCLCLALLPERCPALWALALLLSPLAPLTVPFIIVLEKTARLSVDSSRSVPTGRVTLWPQ